MVKFSLLTVELVKALTVLSSEEMSSMVAAAIGTKAVSDEGDGKDEACARARGGRA